MLRSNNNRCQPDVFGEQKGEQSPFFHIYDKGEMSALLIRKGLDPSFLLDSDVAVFSTFFHSEFREDFLTRAEDALAERLKTEQEVRRLCVGLVSVLVKSAALFAFEPTAESLTAACAGIVLRYNEVRQNNSTLFLLPLIHHYDILTHDSINCHIEKSLLLCELAMEESGCLPQDWDETRAGLLRTMPSELLGRLSRILERYRETDEYLAVLLTDAAKTAKKNDAGRFRQLLETAALRLHDTAALLKF